MNTLKKISIAVMISGTVLLSGCTTEKNINPIQNPTQNNIKLKNIVSEVQKRSAYFSLEQIEGNKVLLVLHNPKQKLIQSFSSEILFPPHLVQIKNLKNTSEDIFGLHMKSDWEINNKKGIIKIASSQMGKAKNISKTIQLAQFEFEKISPENTFIFDINENISNIFVINKESTPEKLESIVNKKQTQDLIIK